MSRTENAMPKSITALTARTQFGQIMRRACGRKQERFLVEKRGQPAVIILGVEDFFRNLAPEPEVLAAIRAESKRYKTDALSMASIDREIAAYRKERSLKHAAPQRRS